jgi:hypothetical protein
MIQFLFEGKNYPPGPVKEVLQFGQHRRGCYAIIFHVIEEAENKQ